MPAPKELITLVERFRRNLADLRSPKYNEASLRKEYLDPFFHLLGWDMDNSQGFADAYKEVIHEDSIKIGDFSKAPDYAFRIGGTKKFFVEAKKPFVNVKDDVGPAFQLRRYAWSAHLPLSILTDFEELAVYDCRVKPAKGDKAATARVFFYTFEQYSEKWDEIVSIFSKDAIQKGSFDRYVGDKKGKKGTSSVDDAFLIEIEGWRNELAKNIALRNKLSEEQLNQAVQLIVDRIIFLRICEDRGIEEYGRLLALVSGTGAYGRLFELFYKADQRYNSGLFHFSTRDKEHADPPDTITPGLTIDDKVLKDVLRNLYYPDSPYAFAVLPAEILGQVYEQFLGKVIRLTAGGHAKVEDKPEVRKAGGVYYTPAYIVDYIVKNTVGKLLEGKTPKQVAELKVLDPACGSGSFLIGAFQHLLDWHLDSYTKTDPEKWSKGKEPALFRAKAEEGQGEWHLTTHERKRILLNNIFGVDIDSQAVEVTKLSLLLKVLEGATWDTLAKQMALIHHERVLPDLGSNIKCGNSLIGTDFFSDKLPGIVSDEDQNRINAFDWNREFAPIIKRGGFDAVIGNPPYIRIQALKEWAPLEVEYFKQRYLSAGKGNYDIYVVFVEKGLRLLNLKGVLGFILPHKFLNTQYGEPLRGLISKGKHLSSLVNFRDQQVFKGATTYTCLIFLKRDNVERFSVHDVPDLLNWKNFQKDTVGRFSANKLSPDIWDFPMGPLAPIIDKASKFPVKLGSVAERIFQGLITGADDVFVLENHSNGEHFSAATNSNLLIEPELMHPLCKGILLPSNLQPPIRPSKMLVGGGRHGAGREWSPALDG